VAVYRYKLWFLGLSKLQQCAVIIGVLSMIIVVLLWVTRDIKRPVRDRTPHIILNCVGCGVDPERQITMQNYVKNKLHEQRSQYQDEKQRLLQQKWDENGKRKWCRSHPQDHACKKLNEQR